MRLVEVPATRLEPGMFVAELDRPWLDTPFSVQGFVVRDRRDIVYISNYVDRVFVDTEYSGGQVFLGLTSPPASASTDRLQLRSDFQRTKANFESATESLSSVFDKLRETGSADFQAVQAAVQPLIDGVFHNQDAVAALLRLRSPGNYRNHHGISMALWAVILGKHAGLQRQELEQLAVGCAMCDVGMTELPVELLTQPRQLNDVQQRIVRAHPRMGAELIAASNEVDSEILNLIENHHERMDGSGYPHGKSGAQIPLLARIAGLADTYDAMISPRPYAAARTSNEAIQELLDTRGCLFEERLVEHFVQAIGLFPTGSLVELNTGEVGIVTVQNGIRRLKPEILIVLDDDHRVPEHMELADLANQDPASSRERWIVRELLSGTYGINSKDYFI